MRINTHTHIRIEGDTVERIYTYYNGEQVVRDSWAFLDPVDALTEARAMSRKTGERIEGDRRCRCGDWMAGSDGSTCWDCFHRAEMVRDRMDAEVADKFTARVEKPLKDRPESGEHGLTPGTGVVE